MELEVKLLFLPSTRRIPQNGTCRWGPGRGAVAQVPTSLIILLPGPVESHALPPALIAGTDEGVMAVVGRDGCRSSLLSISLSGFSIAIWLRGGVAGDDDNDDPSVPSVATVVDAYASASFPGNVGSVLKSRLGVGHAGIVATLVRSPVGSVAGLPSKARGEAFVWGCCAVGMRRLCGVGIRLSPIDLDGNDVVAVVAVAVVVLVPVGHTDDNIDDGGDDLNEMF